MTTRSARRSTEPAPPRAVPPLTTTSRSCSTAATPGRSVDPPHPGHRPGCGLAGPVLTRGGHRPAGHDIRPPGLSVVGGVPALLCRAQARDRTGGPRPPGGVVARAVRRAARPRATARLGAGAAARPAHAHLPRRGGSLHRDEL